MEAFLGHHTVLRVDAVLGVVSVLGVEPVLGDQAFVRTEAFGREELLVGKDAAAVRRRVIGGHEEVVVVAVLGGQHTILGHGSLNFAWALPGRLLLLLYLLTALRLLINLYHVQGKSSPCCQIWEVPLSGVVIIHVLICCVR